ncbi:MAG: PQQ-dependent sugar dehydrogenase [Anaerolineae bacterium]|nr:PQQ-dependent sugar dehydrogenase [Anaerolineae bacterium]
MKQLITLTSLVILTACQFAGSGEPPLPTIVPITSTLSVDEEAPVNEAAPTPTPTAAQASTGDTLKVKPTSPPTPETDTATKPATQASIPPLESLSLNLTPVAEGFQRPTFVNHAGDGSGRLFVVEQTGKILIIKDGRVNPTPFLDIVAMVGSNANEQGLLSVVFHPDYTHNGFFFVNYTNKQGHTTIARYQASDNPDAANPDSGKIFLTIEQPYGNHNGGQLAFGPDGYLYVGMGDGGSANDPHNNGQSLDTLLGKILRLEVDKANPYGVPSDNPFVGRSDARPEIWSYGWRNPWRFSFDSTTGDMYIADVGQNQYEEVNVELAGTSGGQNYGWRLMEGRHCFNPANCDPTSLDVVLPVAEYDHTQGCSVTGGYVYRGRLHPNLTGTYFYADYCSGLIWGLRQETDGSWSQAQLHQLTGTNISSFGVDEAGEIYVVNHQGNIWQLGN